ncbi:MULTISPECIES: hypothetical protein [unclassified Microbacterium]|uniref:hypothetical protein n=1 Tax=unclassified Microbacterium TaxID=2609290 RepID=UPI0030100EDA
MSTTTIDAADMTVIHELKLSTFDMGWLAKGLLAAAARGEVFGVTYHAHITADGLSATASATDGYRIHQMQLALRAPVDQLSVVLPREALVWAAKNVRTFVAKKDALIEPIAILQLAVPAIPDEHSKPGWVQVIYKEWDDEDAPSARFDAPLIGDDYPTLERIIDNARTADRGKPAPLNLDFLADARTLQTPHSTIPTIDYTTGAQGRPGSAVLDFWEGPVLRATAVIQPTRTEADE